MKKLVLFSLVLLCSAFIQVEKNWEPVQDTKVNFSIDGLFGIDVNGTIGDLRSEISFYPEDVLNSSISATISPATINTKNKKRDKHLRSKDFLEVEKFPAITFVSREFRRVGEYYIVEGDLTLKDVTKTVAIPFEFTDYGNKGLFTGDFDIRRLDYGVGRKSILMGNEVRVHLNIPVVKN